MNITSIRFTTHTRTWLLIAGLTALLVGIGALVGGAFLYLFAGLAVTTNVLGYRFSDRSALKASRARPVEVQAVLAHEFGHITNRDILVSSIAATVAGAIAAIANIFQFSLFFGDGGEDAGPLGWIGLLGTIIVAPIAASLLQLAVSRQREYLADATGARLLRRAAPLADALETLEHAAKAIPVAVNPATASLYAVNPLARHGVSTLFATHPPLAERVRRLRALDEVQTLRLAA
jgi:predicted Zn-dependent protease